MFANGILTTFLLMLARGGGSVSAFSTNNPQSRSRGLGACHNEAHPTDTELASTNAVDGGSNELGRREMMEKSLATMFSVSAMGIAVGSTPTRVWADVSDGNALPEGAAQFGRIVRTKADLLGIQKRVSQNASDMDKTEWNNVGAFLRRVYGVSEDMKAIASGITDSTKKQRAVELIGAVKKFSKAADAPTGTQNAADFLPYARKLTAILDEFLDLLSDVPDEI